MFLLNENRVNPGSEPRILDVDMDDWAQVQGWRREPLEKRRDGLVEGHLNLFSLTQKRIDDLERIETLPVLEVLGIENANSGQLSSAKDHGIPERNFMETMKIDGGEYIVCRGLDDLKLRKNFYLFTRTGASNIELLCGVGEILLKYLNRNGTSSAAEVFRDQVEGNLLLTGIARVIGVKKDVRIKENSRICHSCGNALRRFLLDSTSNQGLGCPGRLSVEGTRLLSPHRRRRLQI